jgi:hypothetical protein
MICLLLAGSAPSPALARAMMAALLVWSVLYAWLLMHVPRGWVTVLDAAVLSLMALSTSQIVPVSWSMSGKSWLLPFLAFACACYQYYAGWLLGSTAAALVVAAAIVGTSHAVPAGGSFDSIHTAIWTFVLVSLARVFWTLVVLGGRRADRSLAETARARADQVVAREIRSDELEHHRRLHDTAATTLLMVGLGQAGRNVELLRAQARRDVAALSENTGPPRPLADLLGALTSAIELVPLRVDLEQSRHIVLPGPVAAAIAGATTEALNNVVRHTAESGCRVIVAGDRNAVRTQIIDNGGGFDPTTVSPQRRGVRDSIRGRMTAVGGRAEVASALGSGTCVTLEWPDADR